MTAFEPVIGLEVHVQLATESKIFCGCPARTTGSVANLGNNAHTCPICAGHPGTLPVLNRKVVEYAIRAGLATRCTIHPRSEMSRKNYFYPDLPKGYQISQFDRPICEHGFLNIDTGQGQKKIHIQRIHMEEDAGKNVHESGFSIVNLNRAGVPLVEIVSAPELASAAEAGAYLRALHAIVTHLGICDGNMEEGNFRCDANVSVRPAGQKELGTRAEIKNVNSFRFVEKAIDFEIARQSGLIRSGGKVIQETRTYDADKGVTLSMRSKEEAMDYRYFPDPDLIRIQVDEAWVEKVRETQPELPDERRARYAEYYSLPAADAGIVTGSREMAGYFERTIDALVANGVDAKTAGKPAANWIGTVHSLSMNSAGVEIHRSRLAPAELASLVRLIIDRVVSSTGAKAAAEKALSTGEPIETIVEREGLAQVSDSSALGPVIDQVIAAHPAQVAEFRSGKEKVMGFFVGQVMKQTGGKANPALLQEMIRAKLA